MVSQASVSLWPVWSVVMRFVIRASEFEEERRILNSYLTHSAALMLLFIVTFSVTIQTTLFMYV